MFACMHTLLHRVYMANQDGIRTSEEECDDGVGGFLSLSLSLSLSLLFSLLLSFFLPHSFSPSLLSRSLSLSFSLPLSLSRTRTRTHTFVGGEGCSMECTVENGWVCDDEVAPLVAQHAHTHTPPHTFSLGLSLRYTQTHTHTLPHMRTCTHTGRGAVKMQ